MNEPVGFSDPFTLFAKTYAEAREGAPFDVTAVTLATANAAGRPTARVVLLKDFDADGFVFFTNYEGRKGRELIENPHACLNFYWPWLGRQVRVEGPVEKVSDAESDEYYHTRPRRSQIGAWASNQSEPLDSRETLLFRVAELEAKYDGKSIPRPPHWGGFRIRPTQVEFWYDGENRLHDRFVFERQLGDTWTITRLNP